MSTHSNKAEVLWSPNKDGDFAIYGTELRLYKLQRLQDDGSSLQTSDLKLSSRHYGKLFTVLNSEIHCMPVRQCVAWQTSSTTPYFFALGQSSGKALLTNLGLDQPTTSYPSLGPRTGRPCTCLAWNPHDNHQLAVGLEKARSDSSLLVWDVTRTSSETPATSERTRHTLGFRTGPDPSTGSEESAKYFEIGHGEATSSIAWLPNQSYSIVAGMGMRYLRIFDIRDERAVAQTSAPSAPRDVASHKAIFGLCFDPTSQHRLASYADGSTVYIWDTRHFQRPVYSFTRSGNIVRLGWLPTRAGCLSVILTESPYLHLIDLPSFTQSSDVHANIAELYIEHLSSRLSDRCPYIATKFDPYCKLTGVNWHSKLDNMGLIANSEGGVKEICVYDKMPVSWTAGEELVYGSASQLFTASGEKLEPKDEDISAKMKARVKLGYSFDPAANVKLLRGDQQLYSVWNWLQLHHELVDKNLLPVDRTRRSLPGVFAVLGAERPIESELPRSRCVSPPREHGTPTEVPPFPTFSSQERQSALLLCGWSFIAEGQSLEDYIKRDEVNEQFERAAAIAVFQGQVRRGIDSLKDGAGVAQQYKDTSKASLLNLIALALSGYTPQGTRLWHETCAGMKAQIRSPYLRAAFNFLCSTGRDGFSAVLNEAEMSLQDRVAFACTYLDDPKLHLYISQLTKKVITGGHINGLFLTGLTSDGITLLTNYVNLTGDVQTACLIASQVMPFAIRDKTVQAWFQGYRDLLDQWQLWHERALFDGQRKKLDPTFKPPRQAFVMCSFCSKSITSDALRQDRRYHSSTAARKATSCPNCRKPLPRCSLCLMNMVASGSKARDSSGTTSSDQFGQWFTWCQSCRHGGHARHIADWFSYHKECPVTGCSCHCFSLDTLEKN